MMNQENRQLYADIFGKDCCCPQSQLTDEEIKDSISECHAMLLYSIDRKDKEEIAFWRRMLQEAKVAGREHVAVA